jgi:hypothetical protein
MRLEELLNANELLLEPLNADAIDGARIQDTRRIPLWRDSAPYSGLRDT